MPPQQSLPQAQRHARIVAVILSLSEVMPSYSHCAKRGVICVAIAAPSSRQPSSCSKCTSANMQSSCNVRSVSDVKYTFLYLILAMS